MAEKCIIEQGTHHIPISQVCDIRNMYLSEKYYFKNTMFRYHSNCWREDSADCRFSPEGQIDHSRAVFFFDVANT